MIRYLRYQDQDIDKEVWEKMAKEAEEAKEKATKYHLEIFNNGANSSLHWRLSEGGKLLEDAARGFTGSLAAELLDLLPKEGHKRVYEIFVEGGIQTKVTIKEVPPDKD